MGNSGDTLDPIEIQVGTPQNAEDTRQLASATKALADELEAAGMGFTDLEKAHRLAIATAYEGNKVHDEQARILRENQVEIEKLRGLVDELSLGYGRASSARAEQADADERAYEKATAKAIAAAEKEYNAQLKKEESIRASADREVAAYEASQTRKEESLRASLERSVAAQERADQRLYALAQKKAEAEKEFSNSFASRLIADQRKLEESLAPATKSFGHFRQELKEFVQMGEHATGMNLGLSRVISQAMTPAFLGAALAAVALGEAVKYVKDRSQEVEEQFKKYEDSIVRQGEHIETLKEKHKHLSHAQEDVLFLSTQIKALRDAEDYKKYTDAMDTLQAKQWLWNNALQVSLKFGLGWNILNNKLQVATDGLTIAVIEGARAVGIHSKATDEMVDRAGARLEALTKEGDVTKWLTDKVKDFDAEMEKLRTEHNASAGGVGPGTTAKHVTDWKKNYADYMRSLEVTESSGTAKIHAEYAKRYAKLAELRKHHAMSDKQFQADMINQQNRESSEIVKIVKKQRDAEWKIDQDQLKRVATADKKYLDALKKDKENFLRFEQQIQAKELLIGKKGYELKHQQLVNAAAKDYSALDQMESDGVITHEQWLKMDAQLTKEYLDLEVEMYKEAAAAKKAAMMQTLSDTSGLISAVFGNSKEAAVAGAVIDGITAAMKAFAQGGGVPGGIVPMVMSIAMSAAQIAKIESTPEPKVSSGQFHAGGMVPSDGTYTLKAKEIVVPPDMSSIMAAINKTGKAAAGGGAVHYHYHGHVFAQQDADRQIAQANVRGKKQYGIGSR